MSESKINKRNSKYLYCDSESSENRYWFYNKNGKRRKKANNSKKEENRKKLIIQKDLVKREEGNVIELERLRRKYEEVFSDDELEIKYCKLEKCKIRTEEGKTVKKEAVIPQSLLKDTEKYIVKLAKI